MAKQNSNLIEAIANSEEAMVSNRGMYPVTAASNVFKADGTPLEADEEEEDEEKE